MLAFNASRKTYSHFVERYKITKNMQIEKKNVGSKTALVLF